MTLQAGLVTADQPCTLFQDFCIQEGEFDIETVLILLQSEIL